MPGLIRFADRLLYWLIIAMVGLMTVVVNLQVFNRYIVNYVFGWEEETARYLMVWSAFLAAAYALKGGEQLGMEFFVKILPATAKRVTRVASDVCVIGFLGVVAYQGLFEMLPQQFNQVSPSLGISMAVPYAAIPVAAVMLLCVQSVLLWHDLRGTSAVPAEVGPLQI